MQYINIFIQDLHIHTVHMYMYMYMYIYIYSEIERQRGIGPASKEFPIAEVLSGSDWAPESSQKGSRCVLLTVYCLVAVRLKIWIIISISHLLNYTGKNIKNMYMYIYIYTLLPVGLLPIDLRGQRIHSHGTSTRFGAQCLVSTSKAAIREEGFCFAVTDGSPESRKWAIGNLQWEI